MHTFKLHICFWPLHGIQEFLILLVIVWIVKIVISSVRIGVEMQKLYEFETILLLSLQEIIQAFPIVFHEWTQNMSLF